MGITIHYEGRLAAPSALDGALDTIRALAAARGWPCEPVDDDASPRGVIVRPDPMCEPLTLTFDDDGRIRDLCKTAFAPVEIHVAVVGLLRALEGPIAWSHVRDEGGFWEHGDRVALDAAFDAFHRAVATHLAADPELVAAFALPDGRLLDLYKPPKPGAVRRSYDRDTGRIELGLWLLDAPAWSAEPVPGVPITLVRLDGRLILQLSTYTAHGADEDFAPETLREHLEAVLPGAPVSPFDTAHARGFTAARVEEDARVQVWVLTSGRTMLVMSLTAGPGDADAFRVGRTDVDAVAGSARRWGWGPAPAAAS